MGGEAGIPFGKYRLVKRLARGGMAEVFLARQRGPEGFERRVAVKRILPHLVEAEDFVAMFLDEARLAAGLSHPNVVHIYEFGKVEEYFFIAMEYVDGVDAAALITRAADEPIPPELVARIGADTAGGLHHAHQLADAAGRPLGIVHRDVSPQNLLVSYDGVVKVVDFGIAKAAHQAERTRPGVVKGKFAYMSPEQVVGKSLDGRSDVYSLGLVLWELLTGRSAVPRDDPGESMRWIRDGRVPSILEVRRDTPPELAAAVMRALAKDREQRPTAAQLGILLEGYLKGASRLATAMVVSEWLRARFPREGTGPLPIVGGTVAGTVAGTAAGTGPGTEAGNTPPPDVAHTIAATPPALARVATELPVRRGRRAWVIATAAVIAAAIGGGVLIALGGDPEVTPEPPTTARATPAPAPVVPAPPPPARTSAVEIVTDPSGARVWFDGEAYPETTPVKIDGIAPGDHFVKVQLAGYKALERPVALGDGERRTLELSLAPLEGTTPPPKPPANARDPGRPRARPSTGYLTVRTIPWSEVYLGGRLLGSTPLANVELAAGQHTLTFKNPDLKKPVRRRVTIRPGATTKLSVKLK